MHWSHPFLRRRALLTLLASFLTSAAWGGYAFSFEETFYQGTPTLDNGRIRFPDTNQNIPLSALWFVDFRDPAAYNDLGRFTPLSPFPQDQFHGRGVLLANGTFLSGLILKHDATEVEIIPDGQPRQTLPAEAVARLNFNANLFGENPVVPDGTTGVVLKDGNFIEGDYQGVDENQVELHSVIFGPRRFPVNGIQGVVLQDHATASSQWIVAGKDGSQYLANKLSIEGSQLRLEDLSIGSVTLPYDEIALIKAGRARAESLTELPYLRRAPSTSTSDDLAVRSSPVTAAPLVVDPANHTITMPAGNALAVRLNRQAWGFAARIGVAPTASPLQAVRFRVLADRKILYESQPKIVTDGEEVVVVRTPIRDFIVLEVLSVNEQTNEAPGVWVEPVLLRN
ncbi:MAG: NPCBM/NEW2 domain-containing protein [Opitutales bacterium]